MKGPCERCGKYPDSLLPLCGPCQRDLLVLSIPPADWSAEVEMLVHEFMATIPDGTHGTIHGYASLGCRCLPCTLAKRDYERQKAARASTPVSEDEDDLQSWLEFLRSAEGEGDEWPSVQTRQPA